MLQRRWLAQVQRPSVRAISNQNLVHDVMRGFRLIIEDLDRSRSYVQIV